MCAEYVEDSAYDAASSLAASAGVNASDVILLESRGTFPSGSNHEEAVRLLRQAGFSNAASQLQRLLIIKSLSQYAARRSTPEQARQAVKAASRLIDQAHNVVRRRVD